MAYIPEGVVVSDGYYMEAIDKDKIEKIASSAKEKVTKIGTTIATGIKKIIKLLVALFNRAILIFKKNGSITEMNRRRILAHKYTFTSEEIIEFINKNFLKNGSSKQDIEFISCIQLSPTFKNQIKTIGISKNKDSKGLDTKDLYKVDNPETLSRYKDNIQDMFSKILFLGISEDDLELRFKEANNEHTNFKNVYLEINDCIAIVKELCETNLDVDVNQIKRNLKHAKSSYNKHGIRYSRDIDEIQKYLNELEDLRNKLADMNIYNNQDYQFDKYKKIMNIFSETGENNIYAIVANTSKLYTNYVNLVGKSSKAVKELLDKKDGKDKSINESYDVFNESKTNKNACVKYIKPLKDPDIIEKWAKSNNIKFPEGFITFFRMYNGGRPTKNTIKLNKREFVVNSFLSFNKDDKENVYNIKNILSKIDKDLIPFANDPAGNYFCLKSNKVVFYFHEDDSIIEVCSSFDEFIMKLHIFTYEEFFGNKSDNDSDILKMVDIITSKSDLRYNLARIYLKSPDLFANRYKSTLDEIYKDYSYNEHPENIDQWRILIELLIKDRFVAQLDYKADLEEFEYQIRKLRSFRDYNLNRNEYTDFNKLNEKGNIGDWCKALEAQWKNINTVFGELYVDNDQYYLLIIDKADLSKINKLANTSGNKIIKPYR
jgi:hypothetical protein